MVRVLTIHPGYEPPLEEKYALVEIASDAARYFAGVQKDEQTGTFRANNAAPDIANAIDEARAWAEKNGASAVYVARPDGFAR